MSSSHNTGVPKDDVHKNGEVDHLHLTTDFVHLRRQAGVTTPW